MPWPNTSTCLQHARSVFTLLGGLYLFAVILLSIPVLQTQFVFLRLAHAVKAQTYKHQCLVHESLAIPFLRKI